MQEVPGRSLILLHPANNAQEELQGCIAPVILLTGLAAAVLTAPVSLPAIMITAAGYLAVGGTIITTVSQLAVKDE